MSRKILFFMIILLNFSSCSLLKSKNQNTTRKQTSVQDNKWRVLGKVLDFYDEVKMVRADFKLEVFANNIKQVTSYGKYVYSRGQSKYLYVKDDKPSKVIECYVDKAVVKAPGENGKILAEKKAKYPCLLQSLVHYSGAVKKNRLDHEDKVYMVREFDFEKRQIKKVTLVRGNSTLVYNFTNIEFTPFEGQELPWKTAEKSDNATDNKIEKAGEKDKVKDGKIKANEKADQEKPKPESTKEDKKKAPVKVDEEAPPL
ncbi:MAG: hypothetical protein PF689_04700 [Deltaproteobacteria bacterium]|jgi:hypothetical protein|nr:hypothetical protein [Deltaproteobacteria bacterium]